MPDEMKAPTRPAQLAQLPLRLHHHAFVVKDQEVNRHFFEDILGLPLIATWCEKTFHPDFQREIFYCHTFYGLADGGALAFFQFADADAYEAARAILPPASRRALIEFLGSSLRHVSPKDGPDMFMGMTVVEGPLLRVE